MPKIKFDQEIESECQQCGNKFRLHFNCRVGEIAFCPFCGEDLFFGEPEKIEEDLEELDYDEDEDDDEGIEW